MSKYSKDINYLRQYVNGELTHTEMYEIERAMHEDEMLMDIIEGLETEKALKSSIPTADLQAKIKSRTTTEKSAKIYTLKNLFAAASIITVLSVGAIYFLNTTSKNDVILTSSTEKPQLEKNSEVTPTVPDSSLIAYKQEEANEGMAESQNSIKKEKNIDKHQSLDPKKIMVYAAKPKIEVVIEGPKFLNKNKEEVITVAGKSQVFSHQTELLSAKVGNISHQPTASDVSSLSKTQADLQRLDLDPQTKANLSLILSRQAQENSNLVTKEKQAATTLDEVFVGGNMLANKKSSESSVLSSTEAYGSIAPKPIQNGNPSNGWVQFNAYVASKLAQKGIKKYNVNISFELDEASKPTAIKINSTSDSKINKHIISILKQGPSWEGKDPHHPIFVRLSSEEAN